MLPSSRVRETAIESYWIISLIKRLGESERVNDASDKIGQRNIGECFDVYTWIRFTRMKISTGENKMLEEEVYLFQVGWQTKKNDNNDISENESKFYSMSV